MNVFQQQITVETRANGFVDISRRLARSVDESTVQTGLCTVFIRHTSASLVIQENADPLVLEDLARWFDDLAPQSRPWLHHDEGPDDMPAHARSVLTKTSENIPIVSGRLALGTWQGVYVWEHRARSHDRQLLIHISGT